MDSQKTLLDIAQKCFDFINPKLNNYSDFTSELAKVVKVKDLENIQYSFDLELDLVIKNEIQAIPAKVFSEESGWYETSPNYEYKIIYDPFCNSSLASKSFREAAMGISLFTKDNAWIASLILDYQNGLIGYVEKGNSTKFYQVQSLAEINVPSKATTSLATAWSVITLETIQERLKLGDMLPLVSQVGRLIVSSGHIYWLKLAVGVIDIYVDPVGGEELYEMFAATVTQGAGCIVTDLTNNNFDPSKMLTEFENNRHFTYFPVAASNKVLHQELLASLQGQTL